MVGRMQISFLPSFPKDDKVTVRGLVYAGCMQQGLEKAGTLSALDSTVAEPTIMTSILTALSSVQLPSSILVQVCVLPSSLRGNLKVIGVNQQFSCIGTPLYSELMAEG